MALACNRKCKLSKFIIAVFMIIVSSLSKASADDKCQKFSKSLAKGCKANSDCNEISCTKTFAGEDLSISVVINKCDEPVTVTSNVKVPHLSIDWSHKYASDDIVEVPGFSVTLKGIISAGVFVQVQFDSEGDQMNMKVNLLAGGSVLGHKVYPLKLKIVDSDLHVDTSNCAIIRWWRGLGTGLQFVVVAIPLLIIILAVAVGLYCYCRRRGRAGRNPGFKFPL